MNKKILVLSGVIAITAVSAFDSSRHRAHASKVTYAKISRNTPQYQEDNDLSTRENDLKKYHIQKGDTIDDISQRFRFTNTQVIKKFSLKDPHVLFVGAKLSQQNKLYQRYPSSSGLDKDKSYNLDGKKIFEVKEHEKNLRANRIYNDKNTIDVLNSSAANKLNQEQSINSFNTAAGTSAPTDSHGGVTQTGPMDE